MNALAAVILMMMQTTTTVYQPQKYHEAYNRALKNGTPLLVVIGADWCPACRRLKDDILPAVARNGGFKGIEVAYVNIDRDAIAQKLQKGTRMPQIVRFERTTVGKWGSQRLFGYHDGPSLLKFARGTKRNGKSLLTSRQER